MSAATAQPRTSDDAGPDRSATEGNTHSISLFVHDRPGVLVRVALVFSKRGYNIESLVVSPAARGGFSRMTITCSGASETLEQIIQQLAKLVDVMHAIDHTDESTYETEIALIKVACEREDRGEILQVAEHFNAKVVDYGAESLILRSYGSSEKLDALIALLQTFEIVELVRSGKVLMLRGRSLT